MSTSLAPCVYKLNNPFDLALEADDSINLPLESGELLAATNVSIVSPGTEMAAFTGKPPLKVSPNSPYPRLVGYCNVATVLQENLTGAGSKSLLGARVLTHGAHRSHVRLREEDVLCVVPQNCPSTIAATTYLFHLGLSAVYSVEVTLGDRIVVIGLGTLGLTTAAMFSHVGCVVSGISDQALNESVLRDFNIAEVAERAHAPSESADIVVLTTNSWSDWHLALSIAKFGGSILVLGFPGRGEPLPTKNPLDSSLFYAKQLVVRAIGHMPDVDCDRSDLPRTLKRNCEEILRLLMSGRLPGHAVVKEFYPYSRLGEIYSQLSTGKRITPQTFGLIWEQS